MYAVHVQLELPGTCEYKHISVNYIIILFVSNISFVEAVNVMFDVQIEIGKQTHNTAD